MPPVLWGIECRGRLSALAGDVAWAAYLRRMLAVPTQ